MAERWRYAERNHPPYCTCVECQGDGVGHAFKQPENQLGATLSKWQARDFDPYFILDVPFDASSNQINQAHRRLIKQYHPDRHFGDPNASQLTKRINAARDALLSNSLADVRRRRARQQRQERPEHQTTRRTQEQRNNQAHNRQEQQRSNRATHASNENRQQQQSWSQQNDFNWEEWIDQRDREGWRTGSTQRQTRGSREYQRNVANTGNSLSWLIAVLALATLIAAYLILTIAVPDTMDSLMEEWARLFDQALVR